MKTVYNEEQYAKRMIIKKKIEKQKGKTLSILCKYYYFTQGKDKDKILKLLQKFVKDTYVDYEKGLLIELIDKYTQESYKPHNLSKVVITLDEIATILSREDEVEQKMLYALLVAYKCKNERLKLMGENRYVDNCLVRETWTEYCNDMKLSKMSLPQRGALMKKLEDIGLIWVDNKPKSPIRLNYVNDNSPIAIELTHFHDIWVDLAIYKGEPYKRCECCGDAIKLTKNNKGGTPKKYCSEECYKHEHHKKIMESTMKKRMITKTNPQNH